jgi:6-phosphofructokinase 1
MVVAMRVGVLTGGGDCPGLNAVIRGVVRKGVQEYGLEFVGFRDGWRGPLEGDTVPLDVQAVRGILPRGGTILGSSRTNPLKNPGGGRNGIERIKDNLAGLGVDALIAIGGEDTLGVATRLGEQGVPVVGVPKTIDNDLSATDYTFGFDTAVNIAMEAIDRLHTTAESHHRALIVEVMGRHAGWIALHAGLADCVDRLGVVRRVDGRIRAGPPEGGVVLRARCAREITRPAQVRGVDAAFPVGEELARQRLALWMDETGVRDDRAEPR